MKCLFESETCKQCSLQFRTVRFGNGKKRDLCGACKVLNKKIRAKEYHKKYKEMRKEIING